MLSRLAGTCVADDAYLVQTRDMMTRVVYFSVLPRPFSKGGTPCPVLMTPCLFQEAEMTPCLFLVTPCYNFYFATNVTVRGNLRGNYSCVSLFYSTAFVIVIRLVYKTLWLRYRTVKTWSNASYIKTSAIGQSGSILVC